MIAPPDINLRHLRAVSAIAEHGSLSAAALAIGLSQPALTQGLGRLEEQIGATLFERRPDGMRTTTAGTILAARARIDGLSPAQNRVLLALADGRSNKQIAGELGVGEATVKAHLSAIFRKMGVTNRTQALLAMQPLLGSAAA